MTGRRIGAVPLLLRLAVALGSLVAILATALAAWDVPNAYIVVAALFAVVWTFAPDTHAGLVFLAVLGLAWVTGASGDVGPAVVVAALGLLVAHVAAALAGAMPVTAGADRRLAPALGPAHRRPSPPPCSPRGPSSRRSRPGRRPGRSSSRCSPSRSSRPRPGGGRPRPPDRRPRTRGRAAADS